MIGTPAPARLVLERLSLRHLRNHAATDLAFDGRTVVLTGANGAGKTNLLEAISLLAPGRGLRRAALADLAASDGPGTWAIHGRVRAGTTVTEIGTGIERPDHEGARLVRLDREPVRSSAALASVVSVLWLTPDLDGLFRGPAGERRRVLDRFALALDPGHAARTQALEEQHRSRNRLLAEGAPDARWLDSLERHLAETAIAVAATRRDTVQRLAALIEAERDPASPFPHARLALLGEVEAWLDEADAVTAEERYRAALRALRPRDAAAGRSTFGPHLSDLRVEHGPKGVPAERASTGEQKALLIGLVLAQARLTARLTGRTPFLLLDEIVAHLDGWRRAGLCEAIEALGAHAFLTGTDAGLFEAWAERADWRAVVDGRVIEREAC